VLRAWRGAAQAPGGDAPGALVCPQPQGRVDRALGGLPPGWRLDPLAKPRPYQIVQSSVKALTIRPQCSIVNSLTVNNSSRYSETLISFSYS